MVIGDVTVGRSVGRGVSKARRSFETSDNTNPATGCHNPEDLNPVKI